MSKLPVLTKKDIRDKHHKLVSCCVSRKEMIPYRSGGSGDQIRFYITRNQLSWEVAAEYRAYRWAGYKLGDRCFMFWGSPMDLSKYKGMIKKLTKFLERTMVADTYVMSDESMERLASSLLHYKPETIRGYAASVYMMADYLVKRGINKVRPTSVITSAETLFDFRRKTIEKAFGCPVFDYYGSREVGAIAAECREHSGYHISAENVLVEFVRDDENVSFGEKGSLLLTSLRNFGMPFIRYEIGDVGTPSNEICNCGRGLPLMAAVEGRISDFMAVYDKHSKSIRPVGPVYPVIIYALMHVPLKSCRMIQDSLEHVTIKAVKNVGYTQKDTDFLVDHIHKFLGDEIQLDFEFVDNLVPLPSGKRSVFTSRIDPFKQSK
jgi:phenylacetate-CoA ligase